MTTERSSELGALAQRLADALPPELGEVLLTGSVSRRVADEHSDVELLLVGETLPPAAEIAAGLDAFDVDDLAGGRGWWIGARVEGVFFELIAWTRAHAEERLEGILAAEIADHRVRTAEAVANGLPLRTSGWLGEWQHRLGDYPPALTDAIVLAAIGDWTEQVPPGILAHLRPGCRFALTKLLVDDLQNVLRIVFAVNHAWEPSWKRLPEIVAPLAQKPERLAERIDEALLERDARAAVRKTRELVRDTLALAPDLPRVVQARELTGAVLEALR